MVGAVLLRRFCGYAIGMRVVGRISLSTLAERAAPRLRQAVLALNAELEAADWQSVEEAAAAFPTAERSGHRLFIVLDEAHRAVVGFNHQTGIAVIEFVGPIADRMSATRRSRSRSA